MGSRPQTSPTSLAGLGGSIKFAAKLLGNYQGPKASGGMTMSTSLKRPSKKILDELQNDVNKLPTRPIVTLKGDPRLLAAKNLKSSLPLPKRVADRPDFDRWRVRELPSERERRRIEERAARGVFLEPIRPGTVMPPLTPRTPRTQLTQRTQTSPRRPDASPGAFVQARLEALEKAARTPTSAR